jgi:hypothetical protein
MLLGYYMIMGSPACDGCQIRVMYNAYDSGITS